jgi:ABC-2 type transport system ATP-binding protein
MLEPSEGRILCGGKSILDDLPAFQRRLGYVPEEPNLYPFLSGREYLQLVGRLRGTFREELDLKIEEFLRLFGLWDDRDVPVSSYSKGMRQKILLSAALMHDPDILILDEPLSGLDVNAMIAVRELLLALAGRGKMIFYSSHVLDVMEKMCARVLILRKGRVVADDSIAHLRELLDQPSLEGVFTRFTGEEAGRSLADRILAVMRS